MSLWEILKDDRQLFCCDTVQSWLLWCYCRRPCVLVSFRFFWISFWYCPTMYDVDACWNTFFMWWLMDDGCVFYRQPNPHKKKMKQYDDKNTKTNIQRWVPFFVFFHFYPLKWGDTGPTVYCTVRIFRFSILWCQFIFSTVEVGISLVANINLEYYLDLVDMLHIMCVFG